MWELTILNLQTGKKTKLPGTSKWVAFATLEAMYFGEVEVAPFRAYLKYVKEDN